MPVGVCVVSLIGDGKPLESFEQGKSVIIIVCPGGNMVRETTELRISDRDRQETEKIVRMCGLE